MWDKKSIRQAASAFGFLGVDNGLPAVALWRVTTGARCALLKEIDIVDGRSTAKETESDCADIIKKLPLQHIEMLQFGKGVLKLKNSHDGVSPECWLTLQGQPGLLATTWQQMVAPPAGRQTCLIFGG